MMMIMTVLKLRIDLSLFISFSVWKCETFKCGTWMMIHERWEFMAWLLCV